ncbi:hypothetical protein ACEF39_001923 [Stenotrophomonas indicatrix]
MVRTLVVSLIFSFSCLPAAVAAPPVQLDFPVLVLGETAPVRLQLAPHAGGLALYSIHMNTMDSGVVSGYQVTGVQCPSGFQFNLYRNGQGAVCYRVEDTPHAGGVMVVQVINVDATDGHTLWEEGLGFMDAHGPPQRTAWHLFGVRP